MIKAFKRQEKCDSSKARALAQDVNRLADDVIAHIIFINRSLGRLRKHEIFPVIEVHANTADIIDIVAGSSGRGTSMTGGIGRRIPRIEAADRSSTSKRCVLTARSHDESMTNANG